MFGFFHHFPGQFAEIVQHQAIAIDCSLTWLNIASVIRHDVQFRHFAFTRKQEAEPLRRTNEDG
jgi:hypothetical protein